MRLDRAGSCTALLALAALALPIGGEFGLAGTLALRCDAARRRVRAQPCPADPLLA